jgi:hypothetical protein
MRSDTRAVEASSRDARHLLPQFAHNRKPSSHQRVHVLPRNKIVPNLLELHPVVARVRVEKKIFNRLDKTQRTRGHSPQRTSRRDCRECKEMRIRGTA